MTDESLRNIINQKDDMWIKREYLGDGIFIGPEQTWYGRLPNVTVADLHAISSDVGDAGDASATAIVIALLDDVA